MKGKKQSPFAGRRVPLVKNGKPLLYRRYFPSDEITDAAKKLDIERIALGLSEKDLTDRKRKITSLLIHEGTKHASTSVKKAKPGAKAHQMDDKKGNAKQAHFLRDVMGLQKNESEATSSFSFSFPVEHSVTEEIGKPKSAAGVVDSDLGVFVGGMPYSWSKAEVHEFWSECGEIAEIECMNFHDSGRFKGIAKMIYKTVEGRDTALLCNGDTYEGFSFVVTKWRSKDEPKEHKMQPIGTKVKGFDVLFLCNLPLSMNEDEIAELFTEFEIEAVKLKRDPATDCSKGYAHVHFGLADGRLEKAIEKLDGTRIQNRVVRIGYANPPPNWKPVKSKAKDELTNGIQEVSTEHCRVETGQYLVLLSGLNPKMDKKDVQELLKEASIKDIQFLQRAKTKENLGSVYLFLEDESSLAIVLKKNRTFHKGRRLHVRPGSYTDYLRKGGRRTKLQKTEKQVANDDDDPLLALL